MKVTTEKLPPGQVVLTIEVEPERLAKAQDEAYRRLAERTIVPGFRKGHAPRHVVERQIGRERLQERIKDDVHGRLLPAVYEEALQEMGIQPFAAGQVEVTQEEPLVLKATVPLPPTVELGDYHAIHIPREETVISEDDVNAVLSRLRDEQAEWVPVIHRPAMLGDQLVIDLTGSVGGRSIAPQQMVPYVLSPTNDRPAPGFGPSLQGLHPGESKDIALTYPTDYANPDLAGQEATFHVTVHEAKEKRLPPLDDEFAQFTGEFATLDDLKANLQTNLQQQAAEAARRKQREQVVEAVVRQAHTEFPPVLMEQEAKELRQRTINRLAEQGFTLENYLKLANQTQEAFEAELRQQAEERVRTGLVLLKVAEAEGIKVEPAEIDAEIKQAVAASKELERLRRSEAPSRPDLPSRPPFRGVRSDSASSLATPAGRRSVESLLHERKTIDRLVEVATQVEAAAEAKKS
jgi:trigger factor